MTWGNIELMNGQAERDIWALRKAARKVPGLWTDDREKQYAKFVSTSRQLSEKGTSLHTVFLEFAGPIKREITNFETKAASQGGPTGEGGGSGANSPS